MITYKQWKCGHEDPAPCPTCGELICPKCWAIVKADPPTKVLEGEPVDAGSNG